MWYLAISVTLFFIQASTAYDLGLDLASYVSRPDLRPPLMNVTRNELNEVMPGYWFMAPYANLQQDNGPAHDFSPYQAGPHIYDRNGELVWSGAELVENRNAFDFRINIVNDTPVLTFISGSSAHILNTNYTTSMELNLVSNDIGPDFHEFLFKDGKTSLTVFEKPQEVDISSLGLGQTRTRGRISQSGFRETDIATGEVLFEWWPMDHGIRLTDSLVSTSPNFGIGLREIWDCFHTNALDKDRFGNYLVSMRYTSTIYKLSPAGDIIWRLGGLGGNLSDFTQDFNFSSQHDAKFFSVNETVTIISFLDNASDAMNRQPSTSRTSAIKMVALHEDTMTAVLLRQWPRPDGLLTAKRGTAQILPNGGVWGCWSDQGYISEFAPDGRVILEARYAGDRFSSYRAYKFDFVGRPNTEPPALAVHAYGTTLATMSSVFYVSWNGATEVAWWSFYGRTNQTRPFTLVGNVTKVGFETTFMAKRVWASAYAEAYDRNGTLLGQSEIAQIVLPNKHNLNENENVTLANLVEEKKQEDEEVVLKASRSALVVSGIILVGLVVSSVISIGLLVWNRRGQKYEAVRGDEGQMEDEGGSPKAFKFGGVEGEEKAPLVRDKGYNSDDEDAEEQKDVIGVATLASPPKRLKRSHARTTSVDVESNPNTTSGTNTRRAFTRLTSFTLLPSMHQATKETEGS